MLEFVRDHLSQEELLAQLAEEATELAHAALKLRRVYDGSNPTPVKRSVAFDNLREEIADVWLLLDVLDLPFTRDVGKTYNAKLERWVQRLQQAPEKEDK